MSRKFFMLVACLLAAGLTVSAQSTWDIAPGTVGAGDGTITSGAGTWDTTTGNWTTDDGDNNIAWVNGSDAVFGAGGYTVNIANGGVTVGNLSIGGDVAFLADTDGEGVTVTGSKTWDLNGNYLDFINNNNANDTALFMTSGETLTVNSTGGGGTFDTGEKPGGANWGVSGATLDVTAATTVRGNVASIGQFATVKMAGGSKYIHERNSDQGYANNWVLGAGTVTFDNRWDRQLTLNGDISGDGGLKVQYFGAKELVLRGDNTFKGGVEVSTGSILNITAASQLGDAAGDITLANGGILRMNGVDLGSSRQLVLNDGGGSIVNDSNANSFGGKITGTGDLQIGDSAYSTLANKLILSGSGSDYSGETRITRGTLQLAANNALSSASVLNIGGLNTTVLEMDGYDAEIAGLTTSAANTRRIDNNGASEATLTINVADGASYTYDANLAGSSAINIVKEGAGTQEFNKSGYNTAPASITVNGGLLVWNSGGGAVTTVGTGGTLGGSGTFNGAVTVAGNLTPGNSPGTMTFNNSLTLESTATLTLELTGTGTGEFDILLNDSGDTLTAGGTLAFDTTGYTAVLDDTFLVFENWGGFSGSFSSITGTDLGGGLSFDTSSLLIDGTVTVIPEPATLGMIAIMGGGLFWIRRIFMV